MTVKVTQGVSKLARAQQIALSSGYGITDRSQFGNEDVDGSHIGFAIWRTEKRLKKLLFLHWMAPVNLYAAELWLQKSAVGANKKNVLMHVFGVNNQESMTVLAHRISEEICTSVHVRLETVEELTQDPYMAAATW